MYHGHNGPLTVEFCVLYYTLAFTCPKIIGTTYKLTLNFIIMYSLLIQVEFFLEYPNSRTALSVRRLTARVD